MDTEAQLHKCVRTTVHGAQTGVPSEPPDSYGIKLQFCLARTPNISPSLYLQPQACHPLMSEKWPRLSLLKSLPGQGASSEGST